MPVTPFELLVETAGASRRWVIADEDLLEAIRAGRGVPRRFVGRATRRCLRAVGLLKLDLALCWVVGVGQLLVLILRALWHGGSCGASDRPLRVFVGFGARAEEAIVSRYRAQSDSEVMHVQEFALEQSGVVRVTLRSALPHFRDAFRDVRSLVESLPGQVAWRRAEILTAVLRRLAPYAFARAWWRALAALRPIEDAAFLAFNVQAYAAVACGVHTTYIQHGLLARTLLFARFNRIQPLTAHEAEYIRRQLPEADIDPPSLCMRPVAATTRTVLIASGNRIAEQMHLALPLMEYFQRRGYSSHVRLFPGEDASRFWAGVRGEGLFEMTTAKGPFEDLMSTLRPAYLVSWGSTSLVEALHAGVIPITLAQPDDKLIDNTVFPLFARCVQWPRQREMVEESMVSAEAYARVLYALRGETQNEGTELAPMATHAQRH